VLATGWDNTAFVVDVQWLWPVRAEQELAARTCAISLAASLAEYAAADGRAPLWHECVAALRRAVSV